MHTTNEKINARSTEERRKLQPDSGWDIETGSESGRIGDKQERAGRKNSSRPNFIGDGTAITGKILRQLIEDYESQVASKKEQQEKLQAEINKTVCRIDECRDLLKQIEPNKGS